jgi:uncharacterized protein (DUF1786 family)
MEPLLELQRVLRPHMEPELALKLHKEQDRVRDMAITHITTTRVEVVRAMVVVVELLVKVNATVVTIYT